MRIPTSFSPDTVCKNISYKILENGNLDDGIAYIVADDMTGSVIEYIFDDWDVTDSYGNFALRLMNIILFGAFIIMEMYLIVVALIIYS